VEGLLAERRVIVFRMAGEERVAAAEDAARFRDGLGVPPPPGLPRAFLEPVPHALRDLVARYARTHGPFHPQDVARRLGCGTDPVESALQELLAHGRPSWASSARGSGREGEPRRAHVARQRSWSARREVAPAPPEALARTLLTGRGSREGRPASGRLTRCSTSRAAQGASFRPPTERSILPARLPGYLPADLDALCAAGEVVWVGRAPLGDRDGRLSLHLADDLWLLHEPGADRPAGDLHDLLRAHLAEKGASFFGDLRAAAGGGLERTVLDALWDLVWSGEVTNDTPAVIRARAISRRSRTTGAWPIAGSDRDGRRRRVRGAVEPPPTSTRLGSPDPH
jgi:ATP-dependent Lhr-like helicase